MIFPSRQRGHTRLDMALIDNENKMRVILLNAMRDGQSEDMKLRVRCQIF